MPSLNRDMARALTKAGVPVESHEIEGMGHDMRAIWSVQTQRWVADFFHRQLRDVATTRPAS